MSGSTQSPSFGYDPINTKDLLPEAIPIASALWRVRRWFRRLCLASATHPYTLRYIKSAAGIRREHSRQLEFYYYTIHPFSKFRCFWEYIMIISYLFLLLLLPVYIVIFDQKQHVLEHVTTVFVSMCMIDIIINFFTGYYQSDRRDIVLNKRLIRKRYLKSYFAFDVFSSLPIYYLGDLMERTSWPFELLYSVHSIATLLRMVRIFTLNTYIKESLGRWNLKSYFFILLKNMVLLAVTINWIVCGQLLIVNIIFYSMGMKYKDDPTSFTHAVGYWEAGSAEKYMIMSYRIIYQLGHYGHGFPVDSISYIERCTCIAMYFLGSFLRIIISVQMILMVRNFTSSGVKYKRMLLQLKEFMRFKQLPSTIRTRIMQYYEFRYQRNFYTEQEIMRTLSGQLKQEIILYTCKTLVKNVPIFKSIPHSLLVRLVSYLKWEVFLQDDIIVLAGMPGKNMYFISSGTVTVMTGAGKEIAHLEDGEHFGEIALLRESDLRIATVVAVTACELYTLDRVDFLRAMASFPEVFDKIKKEAHSRFEEIKQVVSAEKQKKKNLHVLKKEFQMSKMALANKKITDERSERKRKGERSVEEENKDKDDMKRKKK